jgi:hypothetical protein
VAQAGTLQDFEVDRTAAGADTDLAHCHHAEPGIAEPFDLWGWIWFDDLRAF